ncbi:MAG: ClpXP protease specificity-enhancing factor [Pseudomonadales bacterium]|nr:ClpXP protease specificity-enhancing factor [Pseudomonadales bacterium]
MTSSKPYLIRALYDWILDNDCTPHIVVNAMSTDVDVPPQFVKNGQIVLNVSPTAVVDWLINDDAISFNARFGGFPTDIYVPMHAIMGILTRETGQGMMFEMESSPEPGGPGNKGSRSRKKPEKIPDSKEKPTLRVVK